MANRLICSFEKDDCRSFSREWNQIGAGATFAYFEEDSMRGTNTFHYTARHNYQHSVPAHAEYYIGARVSRGTLVSAGNNVNAGFLTVGDSGSVHCTLSLNASGQLIVVNSSSVVLWTGATQLLQDTFYYIEWYVKISGTVGKTACYINGNPTPDATMAENKDTLGAGTAFVTYISLGYGSSAATTYKLHDLYANDGSGSSPDNGLWGDTKVTRLLPNAAGAHNELSPSAGGSGTTSNYLEVDDATSVTDQQKFKCNATGGQFAYQMNHICGPTADHMGYIAYNASAATLETSINNSLGAGAVSVSGGTLNDGTGLTVDFVGDRFRGWQNPFTWSDYSLTGGTAPKVTITHVREGSYASDDDSSYVGGTSGKDTYEFENFGFVASTVRGACVRVTHRKGDPSSRSVGVKIRNDSATPSTPVDYDHADTASSALTYLVTPFLLPVDPGTNAAWTQDNLETTQFGPKVA